ncbi:MAG: putative bifunctional diguanylate cyclase/phosphodiesterase [Actinomycetota bacterium]
MPLTRALRLYVAAVAGTGAVVVGASVTEWVPQLAAGVGPPFWVFAAFLLLTERVRIPRRNEDDESNISTTFAFALLIVYGAAAAVTAQAGATLLVDVFQRKPWWKTCFNVGQLALTLAAAGLVLRLTPDLPTGESMRFNVAELPAVVGSAAAFFVANVTLNGIALARAQQRPLLRYLGDDVTSEAPAMGALLLMAPMLVAMGEFGLFVTPLVAVPLLGVWMQGRLSVRTLHQALHDAITGLPNRASFARELAGATRRAGERRVAVVLFDLGRFRDINETLGHQSGDRVLCEVGKRLQAESDDRSVFLAHLGGDQFAVLLRPDAYGGAGAEVVAARLLDALDAPLDVDGLPLYVGAAAGIALYPEHGNAADVMRHADVALSAAREAGSRCRVYEPRLSTHTPMQLAMVAELRRALSSQTDMVLHYQPKVDIASGEVRGAEALVRWNHPSLGLIYPDAFVPLAERTGQIAELTSWVLDVALRDCAAWQRGGLDAGVAVNISPREFVDRALVEKVLSALAHHRLRAESLSLEITENAFLRDPATAVTMLDELRSHGVRVSLDDFGSGFSSLAYLKDLPLTEVKVDKAFVLSMATEPRNEMIVRSIVELGHNLGVDVVAEGVDDEETLDRLRAMGCDLAQGYLIARPMDATRLDRWSSTAVPGKAVTAAGIMRLDVAKSR